MKQQLVWKTQKLETVTEQTVKDILLDRMALLGFDTTELERVAKHVIFSVNGVMTRKLDTVVKAGSKIGIMPAHKAG